MTDSQTTMDVAVAPVNTTGFLTIRYGYADQEDIYYGGVAALQLTGLLRGLSPTALTPTEVIGLKKTHAINTPLSLNTVKMMTLHYVINDKVSATGDTTIVANWTFSTSPLMSTIRDTGGNKAIAFDATGSAVNWLRVTNSSTGVNVILGTDGSDTNVNLELQAKGAGIVILEDGAEMETTDPPTTDKQVVNKKYVDDSVGSPQVEYIVDKDTGMYLEAMALGNAVITETPASNQAGTSDAAFGMATASSGVEQALPFRPGSASAVTFGMSIFIKKSSVGVADTIHAEIQGDSAGAPDGTPVTNGTSASIIGNSLSLSYASQAFTWASTPTLVAGALYWLVFKRDGVASDTDFYQLRYTAGFRGYRAPGVGAAKFTTVWTTNTGANDMFDFDFGSSFGGGIVKAIYNPANGYKLSATLIGLM